jgi:hypothetical protein
MQHSQLPSSFSSSSWWTHDVDLTLVDGALLAKTAPFRKLHSFVRHTRADYDLKVSKDDIIPSIHAASGAISAENASLLVPQDAFALRIS